jgi:type IX secretion system PorP/SprF family membrane protein
MKRALIFIAVLIGICAHAQQEVQVSQYIVSPMLINPAFSSIHDYWETNVVYRNQWVGIDDAPVSYYLSSQTTIGKPHWGRTHKGDFHNWHGVGGLILKDQLGPFNNLKVKANYSYNIALTQGKEYGYEHRDGLRIAFGAFGGYTNYRVDKGILGQGQTSGLDRVAHNNSLNDITYQLLAENSVSAFDLTMGAVIYYAETYFLGVSSSQILQSKIELTDNSALARHWFITGMIKKELNEQWFLIPSVLAKYTPGAPLSMDFSIQADWEDQVYMGLGYRHQDAVAAFIGSKIKWGEKVKKFRTDKHRYIIHAYYSYDLTTSRLSNKELVNKSTGSHELTLGFLLPPMYHERNAEDTWKKTNTNNLHKKHLKVR